MAVICESGVYSPKDSRFSFEWAVALRSKHPDAPCGDGYMIRSHDGGLLVALTDGAGSGLEANRVSQKALRALGESNTADLPSLFQAVHEAVQGTRGAAMCLAHLDYQNAEIAWAAIGDIDGVLFGASGGKPLGSVLQKGGTLGFPHSAPHVSRMKMVENSRLLLVSDGVRRRYRDADLPDVAAENLAHGILDTHARPNDDSSVLVIHTAMGAAP